MNMRKAFWVLPPFVAAAMAIILSIYYAPDSKVDTQISPLQRAAVARGKHILEDVHYYKAFNTCYDTPVVQSWIAFYENGSRDEQVVKKVCRECMIALLHGIFQATPEDPFARFDLEATDLLREALQRWAKTKQQDLTPKQQKRLDTLLQAAGIGGG